MIIILFIVFLYVDMIIVMFIVFSVHHDSNEDLYL